MHHKNKRKVEKNRNALKIAFGSNEYGLADLPSKISGVKISRLVVGESMGCSRCFPHGYETVNRKGRKFQRNWKKYRKTQWKVKE